jgi:hypothetical protein
MGTQIQRAAESAIDSHTEDLMTMRMDVCALKADVENLKDNMGELRDDVRGLHSGALALRADVERGFFELRAEVKHDFSQVRIERERDFRILFGALIFVALGLAGLMAKAFGWIH